MKKLILSALFTAGLVAGIEAAPTDTVTQADLQAIIQRLNKLESENKAQAARIAELEGKNKDLIAKQAATEQKVATVAVAKADAKGAKADKTTEVSESGRIFTTDSGKKYYLADTTANIFEPLTESGLQITPYGYLVLEGLYTSHRTDLDWTADMVGSRSGRGNKGTTLSVQDSIMGVQFMTPERQNGWKFSGKAEFDLVDAQSYASCDANDYGFHWRHLYVNAEHESGWNVLFGQTWHLWKMVTPNEIDGAWMENTGHPYRRSPQIRVEKTWELDQDSSLNIRTGFVKNGPGMGEDRDKDGWSDNSSSCWGLFEAAAVYERKAFWEEGDRRWLLGLGGQYGKDESRRPTAWDDQGIAKKWEGNYDQYDTDMIMLAGKLPFFQKFTLTGQIYAGQNLGRVQAGCGQGVGYADFDHRGSEVSTVGGFYDLRYDLNDTWAFAVGYGFDDPTDSDARGSKGVLRNDRTYVDAFYQVNANLHFGLEYAYLTTKYTDEDDVMKDDKFDSHRIQFTAFYDF